ncbi:hypothetical protein FIU89_18470 [Roseovarius sp. THAF27]|uniref:YraN family protein n=1 Tax=unclassified Roseovarius TaxID=2614913 RepID=UPI0012685DFD|nr:MULTISPECIES: YraN family protein [unclassified Roseovarius]QFT82618.1 hypothetical protein FIU89_18470 [Roseovarius sp. THAF27]QFT98351.1 hypothetical protein FIU85_13645 [Roseovarius sp. THAF8]
MTCDTILQRRRERGQRAYHKGASAEKSVALEYDRRGVDLLETRWRGQGGEIDLIFLDRGVYVFCEVKASDTVDSAMALLRPAQMQRIHVAASEYLGQTPEGQLSEVRFDLAVVDGQGAVTVMENAFGHF